MRRRDRLAGRTAFRLLLLGCVLTPALHSQDIGFMGPGLEGSGPSTGLPSVTESKPESKLWFHDGSWFGSLWSAPALAFHIHRLDPGTHEWLDTGVAIDSRPDSHSDALWDGSKLYIATHEFSVGVGSPGEPLLILRFSYQAGRKSFVLDEGFPVQFGDASTETLVIDKDSTGTVWAAWKQEARVFISHTQGSDTSWSMPMILPGNTSDFTPDDICSLIHFGDRIGVLWSDQAANGYFFTSHVDGDPDTTWSSVETALGGESDDHINLKADAAGRVFAAVKNAADEIKLLVRTGGNWQQFLVAAAPDGFTRAIVLLDEEDQLVHVFATSGNSIFEKVSPLAAIAFPAGTGTEVIRDGSGLAVNNATSFKQSFDDSTGLVVLAANVTTKGHYWHHEVAPSPGGLLLAPIEPGIAGVKNVFTITGATPGALVGLFASLSLGSELVPLHQCPAGVEIDLGQPLRRIGIARADRQGVATLVHFVPPSKAGELFHFQAVEPAACQASNLVHEEF